MVFFAWAFAGGCTSPSLCHVHIENHKYRLPPDSFSRPLERRLRLRHKLQNGHYRRKRRTPFSDDNAVGRENAGSRYEDVEPGHSCLVASSGERESFARGKRMSAGFIGQPPDFTQRLRDGAFRSPDSTNMLCRQTAEGEQMTAGWSLTHRDARQPLIEDAMGKPDCT